MIFLSQFVAELEKGKIMYDAHFNKKILVKSPILCVLADNPRALKFEHPMGSCANQFCRKCNVSLFTNFLKCTLIKVLSCIKEAVCTST